MNQVATLAQNRIAEVTRRLSDRCDRKEVSDTVRLIMGRYNQKPQGDADLYIRQMADLLSEYPADVVRAFQKPAHDPLPASEFLPSISTVKEAADRLKGYLDTEMDTATKANERDSQIARQLAEREADENFHKDTAEERAAHVEEVLGKHRPNTHIPPWCLDETQDLSPADRDRLEAYKKRAKLFERTQRHNPELLLRSLENLEAINRGD